MSTRASITVTLPQTQLHILRHTVQNTVANQRCALYETIKTIAPTLTRNQRDTATTNPTTQTQLEKALRNHPALTAHRAPTTTPDVVHHLVTQGTRIIERATRDNSRITRDMFTIPTTRTTTYNEGPVHVTFHPTTRTVTIELEHPTTAHHHTSCDLFQLITSHLGHLHWSPGHLAAA